MDAQVPRIKAERLVTRHSHRPYRPRVSYPPAPNPLEFIRQRAVNLCIEQREQQRKKAEERKKVNNAVKEGAVAKNREKKTRRKYKFTYIQPTIDEEGNPIEPKKLVTARDLATMMPVDKGSIVVCNPNVSLVRIKEKKGEAKKEETETVAKPRYNNFNHTIIFTTKYTREQDLDQIFEEFQQ